jgi:hypothetical protein
MTRDAIIVTLVLLSHPFMDLFTYFTPIFWPLYNNSIYIVVEMTTNMDNVSQVHLLFDILLEPVMFYQTHKSRGCYYAGDFGGIGFKALSI